MGEGGSFLRRHPSFKNLKSFDTWVSKPFASNGREFPILSHTSSQKPSVTSWSVSSAIHGPVHLSSFSARVDQSDSFKSYGAGKKLVLDFLREGYHNSKNTLRDTRLAFKFSVENLILTQYSYSFRSRVDQPLVRKI